MTQGITPAVEMIHQLPGRVRFRVPALRMDQWVACYLEQRLAACAGIRQVGAGVAEGRIDFVIFFWDPLEPQPHDVDVKALLRIAVVYNVPIACNRATADFVLSSPLMETEYVRQVWDYGVRPELR